MAKINEGERKSSPPPPPPPHQQQQSRQLEMMQSMTMNMTSGMTTSRFLTPTTPTCRHPHLLSRRKVDWTETIDIDCRQLIWWVSDLDY